ncbi:hypothetical protein [Bacillus stratosphericus]|uniref:hypothetical protein n=1 Tax=Bacillus stratosphericus TaxID=293386 RepID=UPI001CFA4D46|nr:hypothetical protein [Bacillus stratosphericus]
MQSVLTLLVAKGLNPSLYCLIETLTDRYVKNAERPGAIQVIHTSDATPPPPALAGKTYLTVLRHFLEHHVIIVGVQKRRIHDESSLWKMSFIQRASYCALKQCVF